VEETQADHRRGAEKRRDHAAQRSRNQRISRKDAKIAKAQRTKSCHKNKKIRPFYAEKTGILKTLEGLSNRGRVASDFAKEGINGEIAGGESSDHHRVRSRDRPGCCGVASSPWRANSRQRHRRRAIGRDRGRHPRQGG